MIILVLLLSLAYVSVLLVIWADYKYNDRSLKLALFTAIFFGIWFCINIVIMSQFL